MEHRLKNRSLGVFKCRRDDSDANLCLDSIKISIALPLLSIIYQYEYGHSLECSPFTGAILAFLG